MSNFLQIEVMIPEVEVYSNHCQLYHITSLSCMNSDYTIPGHGYVFGTKLSYSNEYWWDFTNNSLSSGSGYVPAIKQIQKHLWALW